MTASRQPAQPAGVRKSARKPRRRLPREILPLRVISGGQTGVDRAALDAAISAGLPVSGWCPLGRRAEDGRIDPRYGLHETPTAGYAERTRWNVRDADATLVFTSGPPSRGTSLTCASARIQQRPYLVIDRQVVTSAEAVEAIRTWIDEVGIQVLNVAGPRESSSPGIYDWSLALLTHLFTEAQG